jgi:hypothetical protein
VPGPNYGVVQGHVYDIATGAPLAQARIQLSSALASFDVRTDDQGGYNLPNVMVGRGPQLTSLVGLYAGADGYYGEGGSTTITVKANDIVTWDFRLTRMHYARVRGTVRDGASHEPISGVTAQLYQVAKTTGTDGTFLSEPIPTPYPGVPVDYSFGITTYDQNYWGDTVRTTLRPDETVTADAPLPERHPARHRRQRLDPAANPGRHRQLGAVHLSAHHDRCPG